MFGIIISSIVGLCGGYLYGLFFVYQRERVLFTQQASILITFVTPIVTRIVLFALICYYLLITTRIHFILTLMCFITGFWSSILRKKAISYGRL